MQLRTERQFVNFACALLFRDVRLLPAEPLRAFASDLRYLLLSSTLAEPPNASADERRLAGRSIGWLGAVIGAARLSDICLHEATSP